MKNVGTVLARIGIGIAAALGVATVGSIIYAIWYEEKFQQEQQEERWKAAWKKHQKTYTDGPEDHDDGPHERQYIDLTELKGRVDNWQEKLENFSPSASPEKT